MVKYVRLNWLNRQRSVLITSHKRVIFPLKACVRTRSVNKWQTIQRVPERCEEEKTIFLLPFIHWGQPNFFFYRIRRYNMKYLSLFFIFGPFVSEPGQIFFLQIIQFEIFLLCTCSNVLTGVQSSVKYYVERSNKAQYFTLCREISFET